ncbi:MAG: BatD family protein [Verrucomicrobia bacterium]|nr:BatD family protein [Verrucomicrobiota bacterium]
MRLLFLCLLISVCHTTARAEEASVSASLSSATTAVGEPVELEITVQGTQKAAAPQLRVPGLDFQYNGASTQIQMNNFDVSRSVKHTYTVLAQKEGTFTIPAVSIEVSGKKIWTQPLQLTVSSSPGGGSAGAQENKFAYAEWVLPKSSAYVGEALPAELRLYVDSRVQCQLEQLPAISGDGFTVQKTSKPQQRQIHKDGREYTLVIFKTAITPVKAGKLPISAEIHTLAVLPSKRPRMPRMSPIDQFFGDPFSNGFFQTQQQVTIRPDPLEMEIKPLPTEGKPAHFSGAVGQFTLETKAAPVRLKAGDPVTITVAVKGVGSFDRMNAPAIAEEPGWHIYPPSGKFQADDEAGISGTKTFEIAAIPETAKTELPAVLFSFFNPSTEKYETLTGERIALLMEDAPAATPTPSPAAIAATPSAAPTAMPTPKPNEIQYIRVDAASWGVSFDPVWRTRNFWLFQLLPFSALLALGGWHWRRARLGDGIARRTATLRQAKALAFRMLRQEKAPTAEFFDAAIRVIQLETALRIKEIEPGAIDAEIAIASRPLDCETAEGIRRLFATHDELRYAGVGSSGREHETSVHPDQRERVLQILAQFETSHA